MPEEKSLADPAHVPASPPSIARSTVQVFVRKGSYDGERILSFTLPQGVRGSEIIRRGFAIDGNRAVAVIEWYTTVEGNASGEGRLVTTWKTRDAETEAEIDEGDSITSPDAAVWAKYHPQVFQALHATERLVVEWLTDLGHEVEFK